MSEEVRLMKVMKPQPRPIRCGCDGYFGYPITPQSEILETLMLLKPWKQQEWQFYRQKVKYHQ